MTEHTDEFAAVDNMVGGWEMLQDESWSEAVAQAMTDTAVSADEFAAGSASSSGYGAADELRFVCSVLFRGGEVVGHFVDVAGQAQTWGVRSVASLAASREAERG